MYINRLRVASRREDAKDAKRREPSQELDRLVYAVIGAAIEVHRVLGPGFLEEVYKQALIIEFLARGIPYECEKSVTVTYKGQEVGTSRLDLLIANCLVLELKGVQNLAPMHEAQVISYLKITNSPLALLINFNVHLLKDGIKRIILSS